MVAVSLGLLVILSAAAGANNVTRGVYDQRQTGEYNIRLNLKDVQIVALLGGDYAGDDYEYDYQLPPDYTDVPFSTTSTRPSTWTSTDSPSTSTPIPTVTIKPKPYSSTTTTPRPSTTAPTATKPSPGPIVVKSWTISMKNATASKVSASMSLPSNGTSTEKPNKTFAYSYQTGLAGDRIPVIVLQQNEAEKKSARVTIVPEEAAGEEVDHRVEPPGEIHYNKCPTGQTRDKNGNCRKLRRPPLFNLSHLTSGLASKLRRPDLKSSRISDQELA